MNRTNDEKLTLQNIKDHPTAINF